MPRKGNVTHEKGYVGLAITKNEIKPAEGVRESKIVNLADDIA